MAELDQSVAELFAIVDSQRKQIEELEKGTGVKSLQELLSSSEEEVEQLKAIIEAQEEALNDQREIIANQASLIDELGSHLSQTASIQASEIIEEVDTPPVSPVSGASPTNGQRLVGADPRTSYSTSSAPTNSAAPMRSAPLPRPAASARRVSPRASRPGADPRARPEPAQSAQGPPRQRRESPLCQRPSGTNINGRGSNGPNYGSEAVPVQMTQGRQRRESPMCRPGPNNTQNGGAAHPNRQQLPNQKRLSNRVSNGTIENPGAPRPNSAKLRF